MTRWLMIFVCLLVGGVAGLVQADGARSMARARLEPAGPVMPGQPVKLVIDVLTTTWFTGAPVFPVLDVPGAIVSPVGDDATNLNQEIGGQKWFGVERSYLITPQSGGDLAIPAVTLLLQVGQTTGQTKASTAPVTLHVKVVQRPAGAENAIGTSRLDVKQTVDRPLTGLKQGDAFTRTVMVSADGVQGMLLPPTSLAPQDGLAIYPKPAVVKDITKDRVGFVGSQRIDAVTVVIQKSGQYTLPGVSIAWWDTHANQLRTAQVPALTFSVAAVAGYKPVLALPPEASAPAAARIKHIDVVLIAEVAAGMVVLLLLAWWLLPPLWRAARRGRAAQRRRHAARLASEPAAWRRLQHALRGHDDALILGRMYAWLAVAAPGRPATLLADELEVAAVYQARYGRAPGKADYAALKRSLTGLRQRPSAAQGATALPALNP